jgi:pyruvate dehydrogenase E2 component (dihydrolipoamide acetyltransferase)
MTAHVDMGALVEALDAHRASAATTTRGSVTAALVYLVSRALADHPMLNASVDGEAARLHPQANIGIAMDRDGDLVVPVIRHAASRTFDDTVGELRRLREAIASHALAPSELRGATFTISNLGMYGVDAFTAIINPPESAILAVGRIVDTPVGRDGRIVLRPMATLTLSADHRIIDGTAAARFMADLRRAIEDARGLA